MTFCCLGWGSLIWRRETLPVNGEWKPDGPALPIEFARQSRDKRITLVICDGAPAVTVLWAALDVKTLDDAKQALASREGVSQTNIKHSIGWWLPASASLHPGAAAVDKWAGARQIEGVVWTALKPKIGNDYRMPTCKEVIQHLVDLEGVERTAAEDYIRLAPRQIMTPYRTAIEQALGWTATGRL